MDLIKYWPVALFVVQGAFLWLAWSVRQMLKNEIAAEVTALKAADQAILTTLKADDKAMAEDVRQLDTRATKVESRLDGIEHDIQHLPTKADIARLEERVESVGNDVSGARQGIGRLESYFLSRGVEAVRS